MPLEPLPVSILALMNTTEWLDADEQAAWRAYLAATTRITAHLNELLKREFDLTQPDYEVFVHLSEAEDMRLKMSDLADKVLLSPSRLTYRVDRLEREGWLSRIRCVQDARSMWAQLTPSGLGLIEQAAQIYVTEVRHQLLDVFPRAEWLLLGQRLDEVVRRLDAPGLDAEGDLSA